MMRPGEAGADTASLRLNATPYIWSFYVLVYNIHCYCSHLLFHYLIIIVAFIIIIIIQ